MIPTTQIIKSPRDGTRAVIRYCCLAFQISPTLALSPYRGKSGFQARTAITIALRQKGMSFPEIGRIVHRDHCTLLNAVGRHRRARLRRVPIDYQAYEVGMQAFALVYRREAPRTTHEALLYEAAA